MKLYYIKHIYLILLLTNKGKIKLCIFIKINTHIPEKKKNILLIKQIKSIINSS